MPIRSPDAPPSRTERLEEDALVAAAGAVRAVTLVEPLIAAL